MFRRGGVERGSKGRWIGLFEGKGKRLTVVVPEGIKVALKLAGKGFGGIEQGVHAFHVA